MKFHKFELENGLKVIFNKDKNTPIAAINIIYNVGSKDEQLKKTGWAHLLEHLMFEGSENIPNYDDVIEKAGGSNNAFTNNDYTNFYITLPKNNLETALWAESDRMLNLEFDKTKFKTQKDVVIEEFKQTTLNEPYGDDISILSDLAYKNHPYKWTTIGKNIRDIQRANLPEIKNFYNKFYNPNNAILSIGGNFELEHIKKIVEKWFGDIKKGKNNLRKYPKEKEQTQRRLKKIYRKVPFDQLYMAFHYGARTNKEFYIFDLLTDILDAGESSRFNQNLVKEKNIFDEVDAYITGNIDCGIIIFSGRPAEGISLQQAEDEIWKEINKFKTNYVSDYELKKTINSLEFTLGYLETNILHKTRTLAYYELIDNVNLINSEMNNYLNISAKDILEAAKITFKPQKVSVLHYLSDKNN